MSLIKHILHHDVPRTTENHSPEEHDPNKEDMARRLAEEALRNADNPDLAFRFSKEAPGSVSDGEAAGRLSQTAEHPVVPKEILDDSVKTS